MRTKSLSMVAALLLVSAGAAAQEQAAAGGQTDAAKTTASAGGGDLRFVNQIDFGIRGTAYGSGSDDARFQRYRDLRDGATLDRLRIFRQTNEYQLNLQADHVGYRDQRFFGGYNRYGKLKASFEWNQTPLFYSDATRTLYTTSGGTLSLSDAIQSGIQNKTLTLPAALTGATAFDLRTKRDVANLNVTYSATDNVDLAAAPRPTCRSAA
jgi:hypothetical protein